MHCSRTSVNKRNARKRAPTTQHTCLYSVRRATVRRRRRAFSKILGWRRLPLAPAIFAKSPKPACSEVERRDKRQERTKSRAVAVCSCSCYVNAKTKNGLAIPQVGLACKPAAYFFSLASSGFQHEGHCFTNGGNSDYHQFTACDWKLG